MCLCVSTPPPNYGSLNHWRDLNVAFESDSRSVAGIVLIFVVIFSSLSEQRRLAVN